MDPLSQNLLKQFRKLTSKKFRNRENTFIVEGIKLCTEALASTFDIVAMLFYPALIPSAIQFQLMQSCAVRNIPCFSIDRQMLAILSDTVNSQGVIAVVTKKPVSIDISAIKFAVIIDSAQDPGNIGTIIRTCDWFGVDCIYLGTGTVELYNPKVLRSTMGSIFHIPVIDNVEVLQLLRDLKREYFSIYAADAHGNTDIYSIKPQNRIALICGNESLGINDRIEAMADHRIKIPSRGKAESLNVAIAAGIIISYMAKNA